MQYTSQAIDVRWVGNYGFMTFDDIVPNMIKCPFEIPWADHFLGQSVFVSAFDEIGVVNLDLNKFPVEIIFA